MDARPDAETYRWDTGLATIRTGCAGQGRARADVPSAWGTHPGPRARYAVPMRSISSIGGSGLGYAATMLQAVAANVANAQTEGYKARRVSAVEGIDGSVQARVRQDARPGVPVADVTGSVAEGSNVELDREIVDALEAVHLYTANARVLRRHDDAVGALIDVVG